MITGDQVKAARHLLGWSPEAFALNADVDQKTVTPLEVGRRQPKEPAISAVSRALEVAGVAFTTSGEPSVRLGKLANDNT